MRKKLRSGAKGRHAGGDAGGIADRGLTMAFLATSIGDGGPHQRGVGRRTPPRNDGSAVPPSRDADHHVRGRHRDSSAVRARACPCMKQRRLSLLAVNQE